MDIPRPLGEGPSNTDDQANASALHSSPLKHVFYSPPTYTESGPQIRNLALKPEPYQNEFQQVRVGRNASLSSSTTLNKLGIRIPAPQPSTAPSARNSHGAVKLSTTVSKPVKTTTSVSQLSPTSTTMTTLPSYRRRSEADISLSSGATQGSRLRVSSIL